MNEMTPNPPNESQITTSEQTEIEQHEVDHVAMLGQRRHFLGHSIRRYSAPMVQISFVGLVLFLNPGMYNALAGLGGAGQVNMTAQNNAGIALHTAFAATAFVVGIAHNYLGTKWTMAIGCIGYAVYSASFLCYNHTQNQDFVIFAGALLGFCAAFLWCAQGVVMMSYPTEKQKGRAIAISWTTFNLGAVIGAAVSLANNWNIKTGPVTDGTYIAILVLEVAGGVLCCFLVPSERMTRDDGTKIQRLFHPGLKSDVLGWGTMFKTDPWVLLLTPMFFASNYFYTYQFNDVNAYYFSTRTRAFNNMMYWLTQIIGACILGIFLDWSTFTRHTRIRIAWVVMFVLVMSIWGGGYAFLLKTDRRHKGPDMDLIDHGYIWYLFLYMAYGLLDAFWQVFCYYTIGAMVDDGRSLAYYTGFYKSIQAIGAAVISHLDAKKVPFFIEFGSSWALIAGGLVCALPIYIWRLRDSERLRRQGRHAVEEVEP